MLYSSPIFLYCCSSTLDMCREYLYFFLLLFGNPVYLYASIVCMRCILCMRATPSLPTPIAHNSVHFWSSLKSTVCTRIFHILSLACLPLRTVHFEMNSTALHYYKRICPCISVDSPPIEFFHEDEIKEYRLG